MPTYPLERLHTLQERTHSNLNVIALKSPRDLACIYFPVSIQIFLSLMLSLPLGHWYDVPAAWKLFSQTSPLTIQIIIVFSVLSLSLSLSLSHTHTHTHTHSSVFFFLLTLITNCHQIIICIYLSSSLDQCLMWSLTRIFSFNWELDRNAKSQGPHHT